MAISTFLEGEARASCAKAEAVLVAALNVRRALPPDIIVPRARWCSSDGQATRSSLSRSRRVDAVLLTATEDAALDAYRVARSRGMPPQCALNVAAATWYAREPFADAERVRDRLSALVALSGS